MIITRTPFRISFFGGGTDYPVWFEKNGGAVLAATIDKYSYISCRYLPPFFDHKYRIVYSRMENKKLLDEIEHPSVRETLRYMAISEGMEIHHDSDLPARTGLGSSSSFTVGLLNALYALKGKTIDKNGLAKESIHIEQNIIREHVGCQDQTMAAHGGFNLVEFHKNRDIAVSPVSISPDRLLELQSNLMLYFTGFSRIASEIAQEQVQNTPNLTNELSTMRQLVDKALDLLGSNQSIQNFGKMLHETWQLKRSLTKSISTPAIDEIYKKAISAGAVGGKLLGAGGGGFMLVFAAPEKQQAITKALGHLLRVPFAFEDSGSKIIVYQP
jgi:D-glycero-alpha-D-manno-heptose-7-phosphate kinase